MRALISLTLLMSLVLFTSCSSESGSRESTDAGEETTGGPDVQITTDTLDDADGEALTDVTDEVDPTEDVVDDANEEATDEVGEDTAEDADADAGDVDEPLPYSPDFMAEWCDRYCELQEECHGPGDGCYLASCLAGINEDPDFIKSLICWGIAEDCGAEAHCMESDIPDDPGSVATCEEAESCGLLPNDMIGQSAGECGALLSAVTHLAAGTEMEAVLACIDDAVDACDSLAMLACVEEGDGGLCGQICDGVASCGNIPALFDDHQACLDTCQGYEIGPAISLVACATFGIDGDEEGEPGQCPDQAVCFPPPEALVDGSEAYCEAIVDLCGGEEDFEMPADTETCAWLMTGFAVQAPTSDFVGGATCVEAMTDCSEPNAVYGCLIPTHEPCVDYCEKLDGCMGEPPPEDWGGAQACVMHCSSIYTMNPAGLDAQIACVMEAEGCDVQHCFPKEPCDVVCDALDDCGQLEAEFDDMDACHAACDGWTDLERLAVQACVSNDGEPACGGIDVCVPPPAAPADGALSLCQGLVSLCGPEGFWADAEVCAWAITGSTQKLPNLDLVAGAACVAEAESCEDPEQLLVGCLFGTHEACDDYCEVLDFCWEAAPPEDWEGIEQCEVNCNILYSQWPDGMTQQIDCVLAADCQTVDQCL
jgi:hypothetical protein